jgi:hypothetical protein
MTGPVFLGIRKICRSAHAEKTATGTDDPPRRPLYDRRALAAFTDIAAAVEGDLGGLPAHRRSSRPPTYAREYAASTSAARGQERRRQTQTPGPGLSRHPGLVADPPHLHSEFLFALQLTRQRPPYAQPVAPVRARLPACPLFDWSPWNQRRAGWDNSWVADDDIQAGSASTGHPDTQPRWLAPLVNRMERTRNPPTVLPLAVVVDEVDRWQRHARDESWRRKGNRVSLHTELQASVAAAGTHLAQSITSELRLYQRCLQQVVRQLSADSLRELTDTGAALRAALATPTALLAAWQDVLVASQSPAADTESVDWALTCLETMIESTGRSPKETLQDARQSWTQIPGSRDSTREPPPYVPRSMSAFAWLQT